MLREVQKKSRHTSGGFTRTPKKLVSGFTFVELLVVMAMIGVLSVVVMTALGSSRERARDAIRTGDLQSLSQAAQKYFSENFEFPAALDDGNSESVEDLKQYYRDRIIPRDPSTGADYEYEVIASPKGYCLGAVMEQEESGNDVDCGLEGSSYQVQGP
jgi:prepilin-type N-terminal cleavage/methylation domain-containing protein